MLTNKIGTEVFIRDWAQLNHDPDKKEPTYKNSMLKPVSRLNKRINSVMEYWLMFVGTTIGFFTIKILAEVLADKMR